MYLPARTTRLVATLCSVALVGACGDDPAATDNSAFCAPMAEATALLEPHPGSTTSPETRARFEDLASVLDTAAQQAPTAIAADVAAFATAVESYAAALAAVDYDMDALYRTPDGVELAEDTSHALTPAIVEHLTGPCGLPLG